MEESKRAVMGEKWTVLYLEAITLRWFNKLFTLIIAGTKALCTAPAFHKDCIQPTKMSKIWHTCPRGQEMFHCKISIKQVC